MPIDQQNSEALENKPYKLYSCSPEPRAEVNSLLIIISPSLATSSMAPPPATLPGFSRHEPEMKDQSGYEPLNLENGSFVNSYLPTSGFNPKVKF